MGLLLCPAFPPVHPVSELGGAIMCSGSGTGLAWWLWPCYRFIVVQAGEWSSCSASTQRKLKVLLTSLSFFSDSGGFWKP